ncbi:MAG: beta-ketoacyl-ACP synthase III [Parvularculaceae bacterium]
MTAAHIIATGLYTPPHSISNDELVAAFNAYVERFNVENADAIAAGEMEALLPSSAEFIEKASGVKARYVLDKENILDPDIMAPRFAERPNDEISLLAEIAVAAARDAMRRADMGSGDIDAVLCACSNMQRPYPAMAIEIQDELGIDGFAFDLNVACASAAFGIRTAAGLIRDGGAKTVLVVNPEICSAHLNWRDRDSHFIFGDVATAAIVSTPEGALPPGAFEILGCRLKTSFSNNIRNNFGFLAKTSPETMNAPDKLFVQEGRKVFKDVCPMVGDLITEHLGELSIAPSDVKRFWLHQANIHMNDLIARKVLGRPATLEEAPVILDEFANTSSAGSVICFHKYRDDLAPGDIGVLCAFGAGYSAGSVVLRKIS